MWEIESPPVQIVDHHGAGDSMSAGMAFAFASGMAATDLFRIGAAAGAVNVTRRGLATGEKEAVTSMADHVSVRPLEEVGRGEPEGVDR